jgi:hypothetical protein
VVPLDVVCGDAANRLDGERLAADLYLVALHHFLDGGTDIADSHIGTSGLSITDVS